MSSKKLLKAFKQITEALHQGGHIDEMTVKWLLQTLNPPEIPGSQTNTY